MSVTMTGRRFPAHLAKKPRAGGGVGGGDIAHRHGPVDRRAEGARGDDAHRRAAGLVGEQLGSRPHRRAALGQEAHAQARRALLEFHQDAVGAGEAARAGAAPAAGLLDRPAERGLGRAGRLVEVRAVEAEPGLEPQRIARAEADGRDAPGRAAPRRGRGHGPRAPRSRTRPRRCSPSARSRARRSPRGRCATSMKRMSRTAGTITGQRVLGRGALEREEEAVLHGLDAMSSGRWARRWASRPPCARRSPRGTGGRPGARP
jgi:hypothetical protein